MINFKQIELGRMLFNKLKVRFPEVEFVEMVESPESPASVWVKIVVPDDDDRYLAISEVAGKISIDILLKHGYHILISALSPLEMQPA